MDILVVAVVILAVVAAARAMFRIHRIVVRVLCAYAGLLQPPSDNLA